MTSHHLATAAATIKAIIRPISAAFVIITEPPMFIAANGDITAMPHGITKATGSTALLASAHFSSRWFVLVLGLAVS